MSNQSRSACPVCGAGALAFHARYRDPPLATCERCGHTVAAEVPSGAELGAYYANYGLGMDVSPVTLARYDELLDSFSRHRRVNRLLDFGCGSGHFLRRARARGWDVAGVEVGEAAIAACTAQEFQISETTEPFEAGSFDVVTAVEVLEHLLDPLAVARELRRVLRTGGRAYVTTPNFSALTRRMLGPRWRVIGFPEHLHYFSHRSLRRLALDAGFAVDAVWSSGISPGDLVRGLRPGRIGSSGGTSIDERVRAGAASRAATRLATTVVNAGLRRTNLGDTLKALLVAA